MWNGLIHSVQAEPAGWDTSVGLAIRWEKNCDRAQFTVSDPPIHLVSAPNQGVSRNSHTVANAHIVILGFKACSKAGHVSPHQYHHP